MTQQTIEVRGLPEGWKAVAYRCPLKGENYLSSDGVQVAQYNFGSSWIILEKIQPRRIVLEETGEDQPPNESQWLLDHKIGMFNQEKKWRVVEE